MVGRPGFIHGPWGSVGNFEVAVSLAAGGLAHYWRDNDDPTPPWRGPIRLGDQAHVTNDAPLTHTTFGQLDVTARNTFSDFRADHFRTVWAQPWTRATPGPVL
ncbi:MAG: hypothetical protein ACR2JO_00920 [Mycobacteriales bacterium]